MEQIFTISEAAKYLRRTTICLQQWDRKGRLVTHRTDTNRRYYYKSEIDKFLGIDLKKQDRVSSSNQKNDLRNQIAILNDYIQLKGYSNVKLLEEIGGGLNFERPKLNEILELVLQSKVDKIIITHKDRLCRFGFELIKNICDKFNTEIEVITLDNDSPETEMVKDLMTIIHCFSSRLYGLRNYRKELKKRLESNP